jgi:tetratricopeptide (TPR) repeat protein
MLCILVSLLMSSGCKRETAKWNFAKAMNLADDGELEEAITLMEFALEQTPDNREIKLSLAKLLAENGQGELGIGHCDEYLESKPHDKEAHQIRSTCLQYLGRFDLSLADYKRCLSGHVARTPLQLNGLAYYRALANTELSKAAVDIQTAIEMEENENWGCRYIVPLQVRTAVAAGLISRHINRHDQALQPLNAKIERFERKFANQDLAIKSIITQKMQQGSLTDESFIRELRQARTIDRIPEQTLYEFKSPASFPFAERTENALLNARSVAQVQKNCLGLMLATRALIHEDRQCYRSADRDRRRVQELGFEFDKLVVELPGDQACLSTFGDACVFLDTRGFISGRRAWSDEPWILDAVTMPGSSGGNPPHSTALTGDDPLIPPSSYQEALEDLNFAVLAAEFMDLALNSSLFNSPDLSARQIEKKKKMATRMTAVLLYHRMEVHLRAGNQDAAGRDQSGIERLGFHPGASLF